MSSKGPWLLIAEDDPGLADALSESLSNADYRTIVAKRLPDVVQKLRNQAFGAIIIDFRFPEGTSEQTIHMIRSDRALAQNQKTPIILISGTLDSDIVKRLAKLVNGVLVKPFKPDALQAKLHEVLGHS